MHPRRISSVPLCFVLTLTAILAFFLVACASGATPTPDTPAFIPPWAPTATFVPGPLPEVAIDNCLVFAELRKDPTFSDMSDAEVIGLALGGLGLTSVQATEFKEGCEGVVEAEQVKPSGPPEVKVTLEMCIGWVEYAAHTHQANLADGKFRNSTELVGDYFGTPVTREQAEDFFEICGELYEEAGLQEGNPR